MQPETQGELSAQGLSEQRAVIALSMVPGVGPGRVRALLSAFGSGERALTASRRALSRVPGIGPKTAAAIRDFDAETEVEQQMRRADQAQAHFLQLTDASYPELLRQIYDPPVFLWGRGRLQAEDERALAIVGTRRCSDYGRRVARELAAACVQHGFTVVSGLAFGIDAAAHQGALDAGGRTVAVLGSGVDRIYPQQHVRLAQQIIRQGALLSEYPLGAAPDAGNFPRRNRVVSGLSLGTIVVESFESGGALITARLALEQNREVFAVPSPIYSRTGEGCNRLIQRGHAKLVLSIEDVLDELNVADVPSDDPPEPEAPSPAAALSEDERVLFEELSDEPLHLDALCDRAGMDPATALVHLLSLEFKGAVRQLAGKQFLRA